MCEIKASQIFKRNQQSEAKSKPNVLQMIKDTFDEMAAVHAERAEAAGKSFSVDSKDFET